MRNRARCKFLFSNGAIFNKNLRTLFRRNQIWNIPKTCLANFPILSAWSETVQPAQLIWKSAFNLRQNTHVQFFLAIEIRTDLLHLTCTNGGTSSTKTVDLKVSVISTKLKHINQGHQASNKWASEAEQHTSSAEDR